MKLLEAYSKVTGLEIDDQFLLEKYYPLTCDKYICLHAGSGQPAKNYPYWFEVINLVHKILKDHGISIVQIGKDDMPLPNCINLINQTDIHQSNYILARAMALMGNDSWSQHRAGYLGIPLVEVFGNTSVANHSPYNYNKEKSIFIESHRFNRNPSFQSQEQPPTIALITPESIANSLLKVLGINHVFPVQSLYFGPLYQQSIFEIVPNCILPSQFQIPNPVVLRMDYGFHEGLLTENLKIRKCIIITNREIEPNILSLYKQNIALLRIEVDNVTENWLKIIKKIGLPVNHYTLEKDEAKLRKKRLDLIGTCYFEQIGYPDKNVAKTNSEIYTNKKFVDSFDIGKTKFKSNKFMFSNDKFYLSKAHWKANLSITALDQNNGDIIDSEDFWLDQNHFYIFTDQKDIFKPKE